LDHRRLDVGVSEVLLDRPEIDVVQQQVGREAVSQRMDGHRLADLRAGVNMMPADDAGLWIGGERVARKAPEPAELAAREVGDGVAQGVGIHRLPSEPLALGEAVEEAPGPVA
jgi:hypothetical protein